MKKITIILLIVSGSVSGQHIGDFDSIPFNKPLRGKSEYQFIHPEVNSIIIKSRGPKRGSYTGKEALGDFTNDIAVAFLGDFFGTVSSREMNFEFKGELRCNEDFYNWQINMFVGGELEKEKTRVENDDGSYSIEKTKTIFIYWDKGVIGFIWEGDRKVGDFELIADPVINDTLLNLYRDAFEAKQVPLESASKNKIYLQMINRPLGDYVVLGKWYDQKLAIISNGMARSNWIYLDDQLIFVYYPSLDALVPIKKKERIQPYLRMNSDITNQDNLDYFRLALLSQYLSELVSRGSY